MSKEFHKLEVGFVSKEMDDTVQIGFKIPKHLQDKFMFYPGQYLTLKLGVNGKNLRRAYSICSSPNAEMISVLAKRLDGGQVSNFLNNHVQPRDIIEVLPPGGSFKISLNDNEYGSYYLIGAGSGITPLMSMALSILEQDTKNVCHLLYGNRDEEGVIFKSRLDRLQLVHPDRFSVDYVLSQPKKVKSGFFGKTIQSWKGLTGRVNEKHISDFINKHKAKSIKGYYVCGPGGMIETSIDALTGLGIHKSLVHREYFTPADSNPTKETRKESSDVSETLKTAFVTLEGTTNELSLDVGTNIVQAMIDNEIEPPYSCLNGLCSTCKAKVTRGKVKMDVTIGLEDGEEEDGYILTCQSHLITDEVVLTYDL